MNVMKLNIISFCLLFVTVFLSCKKEDPSSAANSAGTGTATVSMLIKVLTDNQSTYEYSYNASNLVTEEKSKYDFTLHHYDGKGQLISTDFYGNDDFLSSDAKVFQAAMNSKLWVTPQTGAQCGSMIYEYNDKGQLTKSTYSRPLSTSSEYSLFSYDTNSRISRQTMYWEGAATGYIDYIYDAKGNLISEILYNLPSSGAAERIISTQYIFDNGPNPYKATSRLMLPGITTNPNNIIKETYTIHLSANQGPDNIQITETSYEYNTMGYPITRNGNIKYLYK
jgi:hypothetical protein